MNCSTYERMLSVGGEAFRPALVAQLLVDLARLRGQIDADDQAMLARAAHELKGLAATIGAESLADLAQNFGESLETGAVSDRPRLQVDVAGGIDSLIGILRADRGSRVA